MLSLDQLLGQCVDLSVTYGEFGLKFTHNPSAYTPEFQEAAEQAETEGSLKFLVRMLPTLISNWELAGADGNVLPITAETLKRLPIKLLADISTEIGKAHQPSPNDEASPTTGSF